MERTKTPLGQITYEANVPSLLEISQKRECVPNLYFFWDKYRYFPSKVTINLAESYYMSYFEFLNILKNKYDYISKPENEIINYFYETKTKKLNPNSQLIDLQNGVMIESFVRYFVDGKPYVDNGEKHFLLIAFTVYFTPDRQQLVEDFIKTVHTPRKLLKEANLQMICRNRCGYLVLKTIKIREPKIHDMSMHYGGKFCDIHEKILKSLKAPNSTGIVLLHGLPGTGKTHYIRYLIQEITEKKLIYIPPDMASSISKPEFLPFMLENSDSILIIEDAENIIKSRDTTENSTQAVANLLNLSDGLLGDSLNQPIIATFNCDLDCIDPALLRKGRLIAHHQFDKLSIENAQKLSDQLGFKTLIKEPMVLADIYGQEF